MSGASHISIERRRYAALIDALKSVSDALKWARIYSCGHADNYTIAKRIDRLRTAIAPLTSPHRVVRVEC